MKLPDGVPKMKRREENKSSECVIINKKGKWKAESEIKKKPERKILKKREKERWNRRKARTREKKDDK